MNHNSTIEDILLLAEQKLSFNSIIHKDHTILLLSIILVVLLLISIINYIDNIKIKDGFKRLGITAVNKAFKIEQKMVKGISDIRTEIHRIKSVPFDVFEKLPKLTDEQIIDRLKKVSQVDSLRETESKEGGNYYYSTKEDHKDFVSKLASNFMYTNIMHFDACRGSQVIENELIGFMASLVNAPKGYTGTCTSGGTESIILAVLTYREYGYKTGIKHPEIIIFESAHVAFFKAAFFLQIKLKVVKINEHTGIGDVEKLLEQINENTVAIVLSGGTYAHGVFDQVEEVSTRLKNTDIMIHVDSCLGGFFTSCSSLKKDGVTPIVDFRNPRVCTISIDPHKYGEAPKGCSLLIFRNEELKKLSIFTQPYWNGGVYATPSMPGSKSASSFVGAWISLVRNGLEGILKNYDIIMETQLNLRKDLRSIPEIELIGLKSSCVVSFMTTKKSRVSVFDLQQTLTEAGWHLSLMQRPNCIHITVTKNNSDNLKGFKAILVKAIEKCRQNPNKSKNSVYSVMYGTMVKIPDERMIEDALKTSIVEINRLKASN